MNPPPHAMMYAGETINMTSCPYINRQVLDREEYILDVVPVPPLHM